MQKSWGFRHLFFPFLWAGTFLSAEDTGLEAIADLEDVAQNQDIVAADPAFALFTSAESSDTYTIKFNNIAIKEYIHFISKISGISFIYDEKELDFSVTIQSEEPLTLKSILSALVQTLRINGLNLLEQENNILITRSNAVSQVAPLRLDGKKVKGRPPALVTRFFRIKNASLNSVMTVIKPMMSEKALLESVPESRLLIITDTISNVEQLGTLIDGLDSSESPLETEIYKAKHMPPPTLIDLTRQIVSPFAEDRPLIFVPQQDSSSIFIVSTPALIQRVVETMEDLDTSPKSFSASQLTRDQIFLYKIQNKSHTELVTALKNISRELQSSGAHSIRLIDALENVKWVRSGNALLFITDTETQGKVQELLKTLDSTAGAQNFYLYKIAQSGESQIRSSLSALIKSLKKQGSDPELVNAIETMRYIEETHSLIFTGSDEALQKLTALLPTFDTALSEFSPSSHYWLYTPQYLSGKELEKALEAMEENLSSSGLSDQSLLHAIGSMKWVPSTNTLLFTGDPPSLTRIESIIKLIDIPSGASTKIFIYQPKNISNTQIEDALDELADKLDHHNLSDRNLASAIDHMTWISESQSFLFKSDPATIEKIQGFLKDLDNPQEAESIAPTYYLYNLKYARGEDVIAHLETIAKNLPGKDHAQQAVVSAIDKLSYLKQTNSLLITGSQKAVEDVKTLIAQFDDPAAIPSSLEKTSFFIYKPQHVDPEELKAALEETASDLKQAGLVDPVLLSSIETMRIVEATGNLVFTGSKESLDKTKEILSFVDSPTTGKGELLKGETFFIYHPQNVPLHELHSLLLQLVTELDKETPNKNHDLLKIVKSAKEIKETNSLVFTGHSATLQKISEILAQLDARAGEEGESNENYAIYHPQYVSGPELITMMDEFEQNLTLSGVRDTGLFHTIEHLKYIDKVGYILVSGDTLSINKAQELLKKFDVPGLGTGVTTLSQMETSFLIYKLQYHSGAELQTNLKQIGQDLMNSDPNINKNLIHAINSIQWIKNTNSLLATGTPDVLVRLRELIQGVDSPLRQVFIEVLIIETSLANNQQFGLQWGGKVQYLTRFAGGLGNFPSPNPVTQGGANQTLASPLSSINATTTPTASMIPVPNSSAGGFDLGVIGDIILHKGQTFISLGSLVNALQQDNDSVVVMNPKIIAQDGQLSTIFVGQNIPFAGSVVSTLAGTGQQTASNIEYRDVGINLTITPYLGTNSIITIDITNDISAQVENTTSGVNGIQGLQTSHTSLSARVHVPNNHFVALSGVLQDEKTHFKSSIPCLGGLPVLGAFFSENDRFNSKQNVIFFIRPSIIDSVEDFEKITCNQELLYKEQAVKQIVKEEIDDGIDWVNRDE